MLTDLCQELKNWFERDIYLGTFTIENGQIVVPDGCLQDGQYFRIIGSIFNDGVHKYEPNRTLAEGETPELKDEAFEGAIWSMAVPPSVIDLSERISDWVTQYGDLVSSPYSSESFGGYSYVKAGAGQGNANAGGNGGSWQGVFADELNRWRKI